MVSSELGICAFEGRVAIGLRLLDPVTRGVRKQMFTTRVAGRSAMCGRSHPFRCAFLDWLCCDEFFDST